MRSFAGILQLDGTSPDERVLRVLGKVLRLSSSSPPHVEIDGPCGMVSVAHREASSLITRVDSTAIAGDMSLDERETLHAWRRWTSDCATHLFGDFSFVLWDRATQELFCARDRFGVRPFYFARTQSALVFSNTLDPILAHPDVDTDTLDERAVADYLHGGVTEDAGSTTYAHVRRLPPAHTLLQRIGEPASMQRYWTVQAPPRHTTRDAPARLEAALKSAIADRVTGDSAIVFMSGGLDSTALAAIAREVRPATRLLAATSIYRTRIGDVEESFAAEAARSIGIPIQFFALDAWPPLQSLDGGIWTPEPGPLLTAAMTRDIYARAAEHAPIALHGHPADAVLAADLAGELRAMLRGGRLRALAMALVRYVQVRRRPPWFFLRDLLRWPQHARTSVAVRALQSSIWSSYFEWAHPQLTRAPIELVYPWCDPRVIEAVLAMPAFPWLVDKHVLRETLRGRVSEVIRTRPKTFLQGNPWIVPASEISITIDAASRYVDPEHFRETVAGDGSLHDETLRAVALEWWLRQKSHAIRELRRPA